MNEAQFVFTEHSRTLKNTNQPTSKKYPIRGSELTVNLSDSFSITICIDIFEPVSC